MNGPEVLTMGQQSLELLKDEEAVSTRDPTDVSPNSILPKPDPSDQLLDGVSPLQSATITEHPQQESHKPPAQTTPAPVPSQASPTAQPIVIKKIRLKIGGSTTAATIPVPLNHNTPTSPAANNGPPTPISSPLPSPMPDTETDPATTTTTTTAVTHYPVQYKAAPTRTSRPKKKPQKKKKKRRSESPDYDESPNIRPKRRRRKTQKMREMDDGDDDDDEEEFDFDDEDEEEEEWDEKNFDQQQPELPTIEEVEASYAIDEDDTCSICKQGYKGKFMLDCDRCHKWFHGTCVGVDAEDPPSKWLCDNCLEAIEERKRQVKQRQKQMSTVGMVSYINELKEGLRALTEDLRVIKQMQEVEPEPEPQIEEEWDLGGYDSPPKKPAKKKKSKSHTPMTRQEKQKLNEDLAKLPQQKLFRVINLINEKMPTALNSMNDEISIDLESLDTETLRSVERLVKLLNANRKKATQQQQR